jgi:hypothetical protein
VFFEGTLGVYSAVSLGYPYSAVIVHVYYTVMIYDTILLCIWVYVGLYVGLYGFYSDIVGLYSSGNRSAGER